MSTTTDPDLERLVADMSVTQTPRRQNDGGVNGNVNEGQGTLGGGSTVTGEPFTVFSGEGNRRFRDIPREVNMDDGRMTEQDTPGSNGKRFKIFVIPTDNTGFSSYCFQFIGQGASYCTARNCATSHHHASVKAVKPGEIYVAKSSTTAFVTPSMHEAGIDADVLTGWRALSLTLSEWNEKFFIATAALDDIPVSTAAMEVHEEFFRTKALNFKTPAKRKRDDEEEDSLVASFLDVGIYTPFFKQDEDSPITELSHVTGILARLDEGVHINNEAIVNFIAEYRNEHGKAGNAIRSLHLRLEALAATVGTVPKHLAFDYLAPSTWASIGAMAEKLDEVSKALALQNRRLETYKGDVKTSVQRQVKSSGEDFFLKLNDFKMAFIQATRGLGGRLDNVELSMIGLVGKAGAAEHAIQPTFVDPHSGRGRATDLLSRGMAQGLSAEDTIDLDHVETRDEMAARIENRINQLETKLNGLVAKSDERAIRFSGLGFQSMKESNAWLEMELRRHQSGLVVDVHMVFEHVYHSINGIDTIGMLEKLYKIKVLCIADGVAMTSFDAKTPKFFSKIKGHHVLKLDASYFDAIVSHAEWSDPTTGFRMKLQETLVEFETAHASCIDNAVENGSKIHAVAHAALTETMAWITGFIQFIDEYYRELTKAKFGPTKAWHVTTRLAKRILDEVGTPRYGVQGAFEVGNSTQICQKNFWAVLKSHDVMADYKRLNFKNHPSIATELVKFLAINTSFEAIDKVTTKANWLELEVLEFKKLLAAANKAASSASNKADELAKVVATLAKRVGVVENRK
jgi:hypothetical protein